MADTVVSGVLDCTHPRVLWLAWGGGDVRVGCGAIVGTDTLLNWTDPQPFQVILLNIFIDLCRNT